MGLDLFVAFRFQSERDFYFLGKLVVLGFLFHGRVNFRCQLNRFCFQDQFSCNSAKSVVLFRMQCRKAQWKRV